MQPRRPCVILAQKLSRSVWCLLIQRFAPLMFSLRRPFTVVWRRWMWGSPVPMRQAQVTIVHTPWLSRSSVPTRRTSTHSDALVSSTSRWSGVRMGVLTQTPHRCSSPWRALWRGVGGPAVFGDWPDGGRQGSPPRSGAARPTWCWLVGQRRLGGPSTRWAPRKKRRAAGLHGR